MRDEQALEAFEQLRSLLLRHNLDSIAGRAENEIAQGRLETKEIQTLSLDEGSGDFKKSGKPHPRTTRVPYSPQQQLELLIDTIERAVVSAAKIDYAVVSYFEKTDEDESPRPSVGVRFESGSFAPNQEEGEIELNIEKEAIRVDAAERLKGFLDELRQEL